MLSGIYKFGVRHELLSDIDFPSYPLSHIELALPAYKIRANILKKILPGSQHSHINYIIDDAPDMTKAGALGMPTCLIATLVLLNEIFTE